MAKIIKEEKKWVCSKCGNEADGWREVVSSGVSIYTFDTNGNLVEVNKGCLIKTKFFCVYCGAQFNESRSNIYNKVKHNCTRD
jgi:DNA-directed RNA polymerase subunit RPC12/RpoP